METLNMQFQPFFEWLLRTTWQASLLIFMILLIQIVLRGRLGIRWHYCLWLLLLVRMAMPWTPQSRVSLFNLIPQSVTQRQTEYAWEQVESESVTRDITSAGTGESAPTPTTGIVQDSQDVVEATPQVSQESKGKFKSKLFEIADILPIVWLIGASVLAVYVCASNFNLLRIIKSQRPLTDQNILDLLEDCKSQMGIRTILGVVVTNKVKSPALFGFVRPRLLLPEGMIEALNHEELRYVFLHELAHLRRHDIYVGWLMSLLQVLHWFNPLVWLAFYRMRADRELACDALVLARTQSDDPKSYGHIIVSLLERFSRPQRLPSMAGILETKTQLKRRITMIAKFKKNSYQWSPLSVILIIILGCVSLPSAERTKALEASTAKPDNQPHFREIRIPTKPGNGVLSPDGKKLAFVSEESIWVVPVHGKVSPDIAGEPVRLHGTEEAWSWGMRWSENGKWIAYNTLTSEDHMGISIVPSSGGKVKRNVNRYRAGHRIHNYLLSLSPDGKIVAFTSDEKEKIQLFTVNVEEGDVNQLTEDGGTQPAFSPDGGKIAYVKEKPQKTEIYKGSDIWVIPAAGGTAVQVSDLPREATGPIWSPDGKMIAFTRKLFGSDYSKEICIVPVSETGNPEASPTQIELPLLTSDFLAGWTPDNKIGILLKNPIHYAIYTVPASGGPATQVTTQGATFNPRWSPDGERIYFKLEDSIVSVPSDGGEISISHIDADPNFSLSWGGNAVSPDGKKIVFPASKKVFRDNKKDKEFGIYTIPVEGGEPKQLTISPGQDRFPCWSPDGKSITFIRYSEASWNEKKHDYIRNICIVHTEGGEVKQLTSESDKVAWATIAWSPDGKSIAYYSEDDTIRIIPLKGGEPRILAKGVEVSGWSEMAWSPDGRKLAYSSKGNIWVVSLDGGEPEEIKTGLDARATHLSWSPDGEKIAFTASEGGDTELWVMENFLPTGED